MAYATVAELKSYLDITDSSEDGLLSTLLSAAQKAIERRTRRVFEASTDTTKQLDAIMPYVNGRWLHVSEVGDLCAVTSVVNGDGATLTTAVYVTEPRNVIANEEPIRAIKLKDASAVAWTWTGTPEAAISVTGRWAYSVTAPAEIAQATKRLAAYMYRQKDAGTFDVVAAPDMGTITTPQGFPRDVDQLIRPFRKQLR
jgi:uncharacterized phiE125 gp8 family phage protein